MKSLFTTNPLKLALDCIGTATKNSTTKLPLPTDDLMALLNLCITSAYFQYNGKHYKQQKLLWIISRNKASRNLKTDTTAGWSGYVADTFTAVHRRNLDDFRERLNGQNLDIQFTEELKEMVKYIF